MGKVTSPTSLEDVEGPSPPSCSGGGHDAERTEVRLAAGHHLAEVARSELWVLSYGTTCQAPRIACVEPIWDAAGQRPVAQQNRAVGGVPSGVTAATSSPAPSSVVGTWLRGLRDAPGQIGSTMSRQSRIRGPKPRMSAIRRTEPQTWNAPARRRAVAKNWRGAFLPRRRPGASGRARSPAVETVDRRERRRGEPHATISA